MNELWLYKITIYVVQFSFKKIKYFVKKKEFCNINCFAENRAFALSMQTDFRFSARFDD